MLYILYILIIYFCFYLFDKRKKIKSNIDNLYYYVQVRKNNLKSLYYFSVLNYFINKLIFNLNKKDKIYIKYEKNINNLKDKILKNIIISESSKLFNKTRTNNKEHIYLCIQYNNKYYNLNHLKYIVMHELGHMICPCKGHTKEFYTINKFLLKEAIRLNIYKNYNYIISPINYCGVLLNEYLL
tara:strand:+ start:1161 stop:1712 length:552 start_codon:yes stop_codon:yes gene_type:complete